jgi:hypothetical protein
LGASDCDQEQGECDYWFFHFESSMGWYRLRVAGDAAMCSASLEVMIENLRELNLSKPRQKQQKT